MRFERCGEVSNWESRDSMLGEGKSEDKDLIVGKDGVIRF